MRTELFGVFGDREQFMRVRSPSEFDRLVAGETITVGIRDFSLDSPGRSATYESAEGCCVIWGEAFPVEETRKQTAEWLFDRYVAEGMDALDALNGSYIVAIEYNGDALVSTDPIHSSEGFYADTEYGRCFGTDAAQLTQAVETPTLDQRGLCELLHFGLTFGETTTIKEVRRLPFDGYLTTETTGELSRFVYQPQTFDYAEELAARLERALGRRSIYSGRKGILMSAGFDSRLLLTGIPNLDVCYTLGTPSTPEVKSARKLASQYDIPHRILHLNSDYLVAPPEIVQYTQGIRESVHIHHRGNVGGITADTMYHGLLLDTLLRGHYLPRDTIHLDAIDREFPLPWLDPDPDVPAQFADKLGFFAGTDRLLVNCPELDADTPEGFLQNTVERHYRQGFNRAESRYNAMELLGIKCKSALPFRNHLADQYLESFIAADTELIEWHLSTPPEYRNDRTYQKALRLIDDDIFHHRPPDRPHRSYQFNQIEKYLRKKLPGLQPFGTPWPDRDRVYNENALDQRLFAKRPDLHELPPRIKLRINDARTWIDHAAGGAIDPMDRLVRPRLSR